MSTEDEIREDKREKSRERQAAEAWRVSQNGKNGPLALCSVCGSTEIIWHPETDVSICTQCATVFRPEIKEDA